MAIQGKSHPINIDVEGAIKKLYKLKAEIEAAQKEAEKDNQEEKTAEKIMKNKSIPPTIR